MTQQYLRITLYTPTRSSHPTKRALSAAAADAEAYGPTCVEPLKAWLWPPLLLMQGAAHNDAVAAMMWC
jgi:hypothetical protein